MQKTWVRIVSTMMTLGIMVMIFLFSTEPAEQSDATSGQIAAWVADCLRPEWRNYDPEEKQAYYNEVQHVVRKCAHFTEFALLGFSLRFCLESWLGQERKGGEHRDFSDFGGERLRGQGALRKIKGLLSTTAWLGGTLYACLDEIHQKLVDGRSGQGTDVLIDSAGVLAGVLLFLLLFFLMNRRRCNDLSP